MNLKITKKKAIWTLFLGLIINILVPLVNWFITTLTWPLMQKYLETNQLEGLFGPVNLSTLVSYLFSAWNIAVFIIELIAIYLIWSIFQKKRQHKMPEKK